MRVNIGKTIVSIEADRCCRCGAMYSSGWYEAREIEVRIGKRKGMISIPVCADCVTPEEKRTFQTAINDVHATQNITYRRQNMPGMR